MMLATIAGSGERGLEDRADDLDGVVVLLGEGASRARVMVVAGLDSLERPCGLLRRAEAEQSLVVGQEPARARVLDDRRPAAGHVTQGAVADPGVGQQPARGLG